MSQGLSATLDDLAEAIKVQETELIADNLNFSEVLDSVLAVLEHDLQANGVTVTRDLWTEKVQFPRLYLESIVMNLVTNAIKYRKPDVPPVINLRTYTDHNDCVVFECQDNGLGIDLEIHGKKLFGLYKTFHEGKNSHGVGLFLAKRRSSRKAAISWLTVNRTRAVLLKWYLSRRAKAAYLSSSPSSTILLL